MTAPSENQCHCPENGIIERDICNRGHCRSCHACDCHAKTSEPTPPADAAVDNAIAAALTEQYGFLPLNVRYGAARLAREEVQRWLSPGDADV